MVEERPRRDDRPEKRAEELSHDLVDRVLSKISELEEKEEKETSRAKTRVGKKLKVPEKPRGFLKEKINLAVKVFSILVVLFTGGWYLVSKRVPVKTWLADRFSTLTNRVIREKDSVWIRRAVPRRLKEKKRPSLERKVIKDVVGIPVYAGAGRIKISGQDNVSTLNFITSDPMDRVVTFYIREMEGKGYSLVKADYWPGASIGHLLFSKNEKECTISLVENERGGVNVAISYIE